MQNGRDQDFLDFRTFGALERPGVARGNVESERRSGHGRAQPGAAHLIECTPVRAAYKPVGAGV